MIWDLLFALGLLATIAGIALIHWPAAIVAVGVALCAFAALQARRQAQKTKLEDTCIYFHEPLQEGKPENAPE